MMTDKIIQFWFEELTPDQHFIKDPALDTEIKNQFEAVYHSIKESTVTEWSGSAEKCLAAILVLDQFSRNMFRDTAQAFAKDHIALSIAKTAIAKGYDMELSTEKRRFVYMPFMHSEDVGVHEEAVKLFTELGNELTLDYELKHKAIIDRFGRYPHRNKILGRESTAEEALFLKEPGSSF